MNKKYILGGIVVVVFLVVTIVLFMQSSVQYEEDLTKVMARPKTVKAAGHWVKAKGCDQDNQAKTLSFIMADDLGHEMAVKFKGVMPNNFEVAQKIVVTGKFVNGTFQATDILTKCPSKYQDQKSANS